MLLLFLTFRLFFRGLGKLVQPGALPGPRMLLFLAVSAPFAALRNPRKALTTIHKRTILSHKRSLPLYVERLSESLLTCSSSWRTGQAERLRHFTQEALAHAAGSACPRSGALKDRGHRAGLVRGNRVRPAAWTGSTPRSNPGAQPV
ncbi:MAG: hypothetical protein ACLSHC_02455 [Bilophila wadsworthia]